MTRTPPKRRGITFEVGAPLEARDNLKNWYSATIEKIDYEEERVLIHYRQWSHRYDEWFDWGSPYLRPVERIQLRREGLRENSSSLGFRVNEKVLASWSDCRFYPAKVLSVNKDASYTVKFFDGIIQTVKDIHVKPFYRDRKGGKSKTDNKRKDGQSHRPQQSENEQCSREVNVRSKGARWSPGHSADDRIEYTEVSSSEHGNGNLLSKQGRTEGGGACGVGRIKEEAPQSDDAKQNGRAGLGRDHPADDKEPGRRQTKGQSVGAGPVKHTESEEEEGRHLDEVHEKSKRELEAPKRPQEEKHPDVAQLKAATEEAGAGSPQQSRGRKAQTTEERTESQRDVLELRKRKICLGQGAPSKRSKPDTGKASSADTEPITAPDDQKLRELGSSLVPAAVATSEMEEAHSTARNADCSKPATEGQISAEQGMNSVSVAPAVRRPQQPNPNKYSREPLYRVVKNQPPPVLSINLDHNPFKCKAPGCLKSFRKAKLLHYHVKYYHQGDEAAEGGLSPTRSIQTRASERQAAALDRPRTRRSTTPSLDVSLNSTQRTLHPSRTSRLNERGRTLLPPSVSSGNRQRPVVHEKRKENHLEKTRCKMTERDQNMTDTVAKDGERMNEKKRRDFLRIRFKKKKKKKKSKSDEDSGSNWSTDSPVWSEDELEEELDSITPSHAQNTVTSAQGSDAIRCACGVQEENDFMIQCEKCLSWQHGMCMGLTEYNAPDRYTCYICRDLPGQRRGLHHRYDQDWLNQGHMYGLSFLEENYSHQNARKISATHQLLGDVHHVLEVLKGLQLKINILQSQSLADLKLWRQPWRRVEKARRASGTEMGMVPPGFDNRAEWERGGTWPAVQTTTDRTSHSPPIQDSYISSEHCYQKPHAYYPAVEQRLVVETRDSELEDSLRSTEDLLNLEHRYGVPLEPDHGKVHLSLQLDRASHVKKSDGCRRQCMEKGSEVKSEVTEGGAWDISLQRQWQINLLDHIEAMQEEVTHRMDFIEKELDVLESWLDYTGELEPPEPLARLPQLKLRIKQLLTDLGKVQQIALCCST